jgi:hypothetical protein
MGAGRLPAKDGFAGDGPGVEPVYDRGVDSVAAVDEGVTPGVAHQQSVVATRAADCVDAWAGGDDIVVVTRDEIVVTGSAVDSHGNVDVSGRGERQGRCDQGVGTAAKHHDHPPQRSSRAQRPSG